MSSSILLPRGSSAERAIEELSRERAEKMAKEGVEKIAEIYYKKLKINEFWILFYGKRDMTTGKTNIATRLFTAKTRPRRRMMGCQMWHFVMSAGVKELEWILPLEDTDRTKSYTCGSKLISKSLNETEKMIGCAITARPR